MPPFSENPRSSTVRRSPLGEENGQSLVQILVSLGIMSVLTTVLLSMTGNQNRQIQSLQEKLARSDFQQQFTRSFADGTLCAKLLTNLTFTAPGGSLSAASPGQQNLSFPPSPQSIPVSIAAGAPALATAGLPISSISPLPIVSAANPFTLVNIVGSSSGTAGIFTADFQINFDQTSLVQAVRPAVTTVTLTTITSGANQTVTNCSVNTSTSRRWMNLTAARAVMNSYVNDTGHDIEVSASTYSGLSFTRCGIFILVDGVRVGTNFLNDSSGAATCTATATIPPGGRYMVNNGMTPSAAAGENDLLYWAELR